MVQDTDAAVQDQVTRKCANPVFGGLPVRVMYRDCDGPKRWVFTVYGGPASGK